LIYEINVEASVANQSEHGVPSKDCAGAMLTISTERCEYHLLYLAGYPDL